MNVTHPRFVKTIALVGAIVAAVSLALVAYAQTVITKHADPGWDGYTYEHFDYKLGFGGGNYWGQTSVWTNSPAMIYLESRNRIYEQCDVFTQMDADTGVHRTNNSIQSWVEADGGYADDWWDCTTFQSIETHADGTYYNIYPSVNHSVSKIIYHENP